MKKFIAGTFAEAGIVFCMWAAGAYWVSLANNPSVLDLKPMLVGVIGILFFIIGVLLYKEPAE